MVRKRCFSVKKMLSVLLAVLLLFSMAFAAEPVDLTTYTDEELEALRLQVAEEIRARAMGNTPENPAADFKYVSNGTEVRINAYTGSGAEMYIPDEIDGLPVTQIATSAFSGAGVTSLRLPGKLVSIGMFAFNETRKLSGELILPASVREVGQNAFYFSGLTGLVVQSDCTLGNSSFAGTRSLEFVYIREGSSVSIEGCAFCVSTVKTVVIPETVQLLASDVFASCNDVTVYCPAGSAVEQYCRENFIACNTADYEAMVAYYEALYPVQ